MNTTIKQKQTRKASKSHTVRGYGIVIKKLYELELINKEDFVNLRELQYKIVQTYLHNE